MTLHRLLTLLILFPALLQAHAALSDYTLQPSADSPVASLASVKITFPQAKFLGMYGSKLSGVTLTSKSDPTVVYEPCNISYSTYSAPNSQTFSFRKAGDSAATVISEPGEYVLHFPARCFELSGDWFAHLGYSEEIYVSYTIGGSDSGYDRYFDLSTVAVRPMPGDVMEFKDITLSFPVTNQYPTIDIIDPGLIRLTRTGEGAPGYVFAGKSFDGEGTVSFNFRQSASAYPQAEYIYEPGEYTVDIPAGVFRLTSTDIVNPPMSLKYNVTGTNPASAQLRAFALTPAGGTVDRIESIVLEYPDLTDELLFPDGLTDITAYVRERISLTRLHVNSDLCTTYEPFSAVLTAPNRIELRFRNRVSADAEPKPETITRLGDYRLTVLPNTFKLKSNTFAFNARIEALYTISREAVADPMASYTLTPADGDELGSLTSMSISFPEITEGLEFPIDRTAITLTNTADATDVYEARCVELHANRVKWSWNRPDFAYDESVAISKEGTYRLHIRAGAMKRYGSPQDVNPEISALYHVSPANDFSYSLTPEPDRAYTELGSIAVKAAGGAAGLHPTGTAGAPATLREASGTSYTLQCGEDCVFAVPAKLPEGNYTLTIPQGYFVQTNRSGKEVYNRLITASYRLALPARFEAAVVPAPGSTVSGLPAVSVTAVGAQMTGLGTDSSKGRPELKGCGWTIIPEVGLSEFAVAFIIPDPETLAPGDYTLTVPAGYITAVDGNGLTSGLDAIEARYTITEPDLPGFNGGIFFLNEGMYGSAFGSLNYMERDFGKMHYRVFSEANHGLTPGVTAQYGDIFGNHMYLMSKQTSYSEPSALFTIADASGLEIQKRVTLSEVGGRSICAVNDSKVYLGTSDGIHVYDHRAGAVSGVIEGTVVKKGPLFGQTGDMLRMGRYVFAAVQDCGVLVIDPDSDTLVAKLDLPSVSGVFVTGGGLLFAASSDESTPFVEIDPENLTLSPFPAEARPVASQWGSWRSLPLTAAIRGNRIFYITANESCDIASYDFDSGKYNGSFVHLPSVDGIAMKTYGKALGTDPESGYLIIAATGGIGRYDRNMIFVADPADGHIIDKHTTVLERDYWFPAMSIYPAGRAPHITPAAAVNVSLYESAELDLSDFTYLSSGNPALIVYSATSSDPEVCRLSRLSNGVYELYGAEEGTAVVEVTADYRGLTDSRNIKVTVSRSAGVSDAESDASLHSVYDLAGRPVLVDATMEQIHRLPVGFYIVDGNKKIIIKHNN